MAWNKRSVPHHVSPNDPLVIEILDSDDEVHRSEGLNDVRKRLKTTPSPRSVADADNDDDASDDGGGKIGPCCPIMQARSIKKESEAFISLLDDSEHPSEGPTEVQVLSHVDEPMEAVEHVATSTEGDIEVIGCKHQTKLPHMRQHCTEHEFVEDVLYLKTGYRRNSADAQAKVKKGMELNPSHCDMCYCYVCDIPAKECKTWKSETGSYSHSENHCLASDKGCESHMWKPLRNSKKGISTLSTPPSYPSSEDDEDSVSGPYTSDYLRRLLGSPVYGSSAQRASASFIGAGPFDPETATEEQKRRSTKCRKCGWYVRLQSSRRDNAGVLDWCHKCGRVCDDADLRKMNKGVRYDRLATDLFLGTKEIPFTIQSHDPRKLEKYHQSWVENEGKPGWEFNRAEMDQDMFNHRFGQRPMVSMIMASIPVVSIDKIPETGTTESVSYDSTAISANETEYIVLSERNHRALLEELHCSGWFGEKAPAMATNYIAGDIKATWNKAERKGTFSVRVFVRQRAFNGRDDKGMHLARFFGAWYGVFPYSLSDLTRGIDVWEKERLPEYRSWGRPRLNAPPFRLESDVADEHLECISTEIDALVEYHNANAETFRSGLSFTSSIGRNAYGGVCDNGTDFSAVLKSFLTESLGDELRTADRDYSLSFVGKAVGIVSSHRQMRQDHEVSHHSYYEPKLGFRTYVRDEDYNLANEMIPAFKSAYGGITSLDSLMHLLENLGHAPVPHVDGLTVDLLEFQKQTVQWALEREKTPGGLQSFFWTKLPHVEDSKKDVYFNPILGRLSTMKPAIVRGGVIAEQMGLGKTVISLALILQNPAPARPLSGSLVGSLTPPHRWDGSGWNPNTGGGLNGTAKVLSRGTLVICHVSLVGQWIEESKSKLSDPGLVYPYHGGNRKRDAEILAKNAIVVTTYATLSSDKYYHAKKGGTSYCPPCEKVRWWRIICDESHALRDGATKQSNAVLDLVGDHKWCVSGTPMNTSIKDLRIQLKFVGIEHVDHMFQQFSNSMFSSNIRWSRRRNTNGGVFCQDPKFGPFMFFMRQVMMHHSMKQKYVGTSTELMSLPLKEERTMAVTFSKEEETEYKRLEREAKQFYEQFKVRQGHQLSKHYLLLLQKLTPLRIACSGGGIPEQDEDADSDDEAVGLTKDKKKKEKNKIVVSNMTFKGKMKVLVKELERIRDEEPHAKSLIFSQFTSTLKFLQVELPKHGFDYRTLSGDMTMKNRAKALHDFQNDPPTTIFLLSMRAGACGINLTQANRVFILEPAFNPALEAQAIGRIWRMGQKKKVEIIRMITNESVEARLREMLDKKYGCGTAGAATSADAAMQDEADSDAEAGPVLPPSTRLVVDPTIVGNIQSDRTTVLTEEFDLLFGLVTNTANSCDADTIKD